VQEQPVAADLLAGLGFFNIRPIESVGTAKSLRREWRINANTGELRGIAFRETVGSRRCVKYVGKRGTYRDEFARYTDVFGEWRRTNRTLVGVGLVTHSDTLPTE
jgi:hypothetical protein